MVATPRLPDQHPCDILYTMKKFQKPKFNVERVNKFINKFNQDTVFSSPDWPTKNIDGVEFVAVKLNEKELNFKWMRRDSLQKVSNDTNQTTKRI